jgi:methionyl aminopeptidase
MAVLSNKRDAMVKKSVSHFLPDTPFTEVRGAQPGVPLKPDVVSALLLAERLGSSPRHVLFVGDTKTDMQTARSAGMVAIGALWGYRTANELSAHGAQHLIEQPANLTVLLNAALDAKKTSQTVRRNEQTTKTNTMVESMMRMKKRPSRNDPCWCGSAKKYKKCHMEHDRIAVAPRRSFGCRYGSMRPVFRGNVSPMRPVPSHIVRPAYTTTGKNERACTSVSRLSGRELEQMRETCRAARRVLDKAIKAVRPGVITDEIDAVVHQACIVEGGYPSPRNYHGFPKSVCTSVNEVICHGIPDDRALENGDILNVDVTIFLNGFHGDCSETVPVGTIDGASRHLLGTAGECLRRGIAAIRPGGRIGDIGSVIAEYAHRQGCSVVRAYCGHGIGRCFHMDPQVFHYCSQDGAARIEPGMVFTVEPMINMGGWQHELWDDRWTAVTADGQRSAQFEHTVLVTGDGPEIMTTGGADT